MKKLLGLILTVLGLSLWSIALAENYYPYKDVCPGAQDEVDQWGFYKCECVSYAAYALNAYGVSFNNSYRQTTGNYWHNGGDWNDAAERAGITVDNFPLPGDIVYWENMGSVGHVAEVIKIDYNSNITDWEKAYIAQYNGSNKHKYSEKWIYPSDNPSGFIHILAYEEGVSGLNYLDCLEQSELCNSQSKREWEMINQKVWNDYRCTDCVSQYNSHHISAIANNMGGKGGGPGYQSTPDSQETEDPDLPNFIAKKIILLNYVTEEEQYKFYKTDTIKARSYTQNIGEADWAGDATEIEGRFYLSKGYKEDAHSDWIRLGKGIIQRYNLELGDKPHREEITFQLSDYDIIQPGNVYNIVWCADRTKDQHNGDGDVPETHKSDNCSTEAVFEVMDTNNNSLHGPPGPVTTLYITQ